MKINNIQNYQYNQKYKMGQNGGNQKTSAPAFGGTALINFWDAIARGGFAASFTVQDMCGTNLPRTYQALNRNKEITGKTNYGAAAEVATREFLTGPSMCFIPLAVLSVAKRFAGTAVEVPLEHIEPYSKQMGEVLGGLQNIYTDPVSDVKEYTKQVKSGFYEKMFRLALGENNDTTGKISENAKHLADMLVEYDNAPKRNLFKQLLDKNIEKETVTEAGETVKTVVKSKDQLLANISKDFAKYKQGITTDYSKLRTTNLSGAIDEEKNISSLIKEFSNFSRDVEKTLAKEIQNPKTDKFALDSFMEKFKNLKIGSKFITNVLMVLATALFMVQIPKLYTIHKTNPETDAFRNQDEGVVKK